MHRIKYHHTQYWCMDESDGDDNAGQEGSYPLETTLTRPRGILTEADRRYLTGQSDIKPRSHSERRARERIRERTVNAFLDLSLIERHLEERDRKLVFDVFDSNKLHPDDSRLYGGGVGEHVGALTDTLAFIYRETKDSAGRQPPFEQLLKHAIPQGEADPYARIYAPYDVELTVEKQHDVVDIDTILDHVERGDTASLSEYEMEAFLRFLSETGSVDTDVVREEAARRVEEMADRHSPGQYPFEWLLSPDGIDEGAGAPEGGDTNEE